MDKQETVLTLLKLGWSYRRIERETGVRRETIARYDPARSKAANPATGSEQKRPKWPPGPRSLCTPFEELINKKLEQGLTAQRIHQDLVDEQDFTGAYNSVKRFCRKLKKQDPEVYARIETPPGREMQVDFAKAALTRTASGRYRRPHLFKAVLSYSRHSYEEVVWRQDLPSFLRCIENALRRFGGVVEVLRIDNLKAGVTRACWVDPQINTVLAALGRHYGFAVLPIRPRRPRENGKVERSIAYTKSSALKGRRFESLEDQNRHLADWNRRIARQRLHGTTKQQVWARFTETEQAALKPLPDQPFSYFRVGRRTVSSDGHIEVDRAFYSVPDRLLGCEVQVQWDERLVRIYYRDQLIVTHPKRSPGGFQTRSEHLPERKRYPQLRTENHLLAQARAIGPEARAWAERALQVRDVLAYRLLRGMISLTRKYPAEVVNRACGTALAHDAFRYRTLVKLCQRQPPAQKPLFTAEHELIRSLGEYSRILNPGDCT
jgi:transposase